MLLDATGKRLVEECSLVKRTIDFAIRCRALLLYALFYLTLSDALSKSSNWERGKGKGKDENESEIK